MKNVFLFSVLLAVFMAQGMSIADTTSPSDGISYNIMQIVDYARLGIANVFFSPSERILMRLEIQENRYNALAKEILLGNEASTDVVRVDIENMQREILSDIVYVQPGSQTDMVIAALQVHEQVLRNIFEQENLNDNQNTSMLLALQNALTRSSRISQTFNDLSEERRIIARQGLDNAE